MEEAIIAKSCLFGDVHLMGNLKRDKCTLLQQLILHYGHSIKEKVRLWSLVGAKDIVFQT